MKEREYYFNESFGLIGTKSYTVKESELTKPQKELLIGRIIKEFNNLPEDVKMDFLHRVLKKWTNVYEDRLLSEIGFRSTNPKDQTS